VTCLEPRIATRIGALLRLSLSTDKPGEAVAALAALRRALEAAQLDLHDLAAAVETGLKDLPPAPPPPRPRQEPPQDPSRDWRAEVRFCDRHRDQLEGHECGLIDTLMRWRGTPTPKQLGRIVQRIKAAK
jgi:hypothetical protein